MSESTAAEPFSTTSTDLGRVHARHRAEDPGRRRAGKRLRPSAHPHALTALPLPGGQRFESPQLHQEVGANRPGFLAPTIPRLFSALARKLMVCGVYSAGTTGLGRRTRK